MPPTSGGREDKSSGTSVSGLNASGSSAGASLGTTQLPPLSTSPYTQGLVPNAAFSLGNATLATHQLNYMHPGKGPTGRMGDFTGARPIMQNNSNAAAAAAAFKITQLGPVAGANVMVSRMDMSRPTSASPVPALLSHAGRMSGSLPPSIGPRPPVRPSAATALSGPPGVFYHHPPLNVTKFTNMTVANTGSKNPLKPNHFTIAVPGARAPSATASEPSGSADASGPAVKDAEASVEGMRRGGGSARTTLRAADLIHILPNLVSSLKRRHSQSGRTPGAAPAPSASPNTTTTTSSAVTLVAEQLLSVVSGPSSDDHHPGERKRGKNHATAVHQCEACGKIYKHRNCLSKHRWEHHESWEHTRRVCQTKHQQVQLLEAAQVLAEITRGPQVDDGLRTVEDTPLDGESDDSLDQDDNGSDPGAGDDEHDQEDVSIGEHEYASFVPTEGHLVM